MATYRNISENQTEDIGDNRAMAGFEIDPVIMDSQRTTRSDDTMYFMKHKNRGTVVIFNHKVFDPRLKQYPRDGTDKDAKDLSDTFESLGFTVDLRHEQSYKEIIRVLEEYSEQDHSDNDCFVVCILSHGDHGILYARDQWYVPDTLWNMFTANKVRTLAGKPKLFFIQACQGDDFDSGVTVQRRTSTDGADPSAAYKGPVFEEDFLIAYSTMPGKYAWRNKVRGSWFIQSLCKVLREYSRTKDLLSMMTLVCHKVAVEYESDTSDPKTNLKRQIPSIISKLIREVHF